MGPARIGKMNIPSRESPPLSYTAKQSLPTRALPQLPLAFAHSFAHCIQNAVHDMVAAYTAFRPVFKCSSPDGNSMVWYTENGAWRMVCMHVSPFVFFLTWNFLVTPMFVGHTLSKK